MADTHKIVKTDAGPEATARAIKAANAAEAQAVTVTAGGRVSSVATPPAPETKAPAK